MVDRYGCEYYVQSNSFKKKVKEDCLNRYGVENHMQRKEVFDKAKNSVKENYGVEYAFQLTDKKNSHTHLASEKRKKTMRQKYDVTYSFQLGDIAYEKRVKSLEKSRETMLERYNTNVGFFCGDSMASNINKDFAKRLGLKEDSLEFLTGPYSYDIKYGDTLIEINPTITHNSTLPYLSSPPQNKTYHREKMLYARRNGYKCLMIFDWDDKEKIKFMLTTKKDKIYARDTEVKEIDKAEANEFINTYHLQGSTRVNKGTIFLGLYHKEELVQVCSFGKPRHTKKYEWEIIRLCSRFDRIVIGGAKKLFKYFVSNYSPKNIISYCDESKFSGNIYKELGFTYGGSQIQAHWIYVGKKGVAPLIPLKKGFRVSGRLLLQRGFDQILGRYFGKKGKGFNNEDLAVDHGFC